MDINKNVSIFTGIWEKLAIHSSLIFCYNLKHTVNMGD